MRVIRMSDVIGAASDYLGGFYSHENWDGGLGIETVGEGIATTGLPSPEDSPDSLSLGCLSKLRRERRPSPPAAPLIPRPGRLLTGGARR